MKPQASPPSYRMLALLSAATLLAWTACDKPAPTDHHATHQHSEHKHSDHSTAAKTTPATNASAHGSHASHAPAKKPGMGETVRWGVESLDVYRDGTNQHLLLADYATNSKIPALVHLRSTDDGATWSVPVRVDANATPARSPHRGMDAQIVARGERLLALWGTAGTGLFGSGPMATALSADGGKTWQAGPNPADDNLTTGHGFADLATDLAGNFHLLWLDSRDGKQGLRAATSTDAGKTWSRNVTVKPETCECCWNALAIGPNGTLHALFRDKTPRDMALATSPDRGLTWSPPVKVGRFDWEFQGCPHVGGSLALRPTSGDAYSLHALVWTGVTGKSGAYHLASGDLGKTWSEPQRIGDSDARRGDLASRTATSLAAVWDRVADGESVIMAALSNDAGKTWSPPRRLSEGTANAAYPRLVATATGYRVFWTESAKDRPGTWKTSLLAD